VGRRGLLRRTLDAATWWLAGPPAPWLALAGGVVSAFLWREGIDAVRATVLLGSMGGVLVLLHAFPPGGEPPAPPAAGAPWRRWLDVAAWWTTVNLAQSSLWFAIPFYVVSTSWLSANVVFTALLVGLGVLSCFDVWLHQRVLCHAPVAAAFVAIALLATLQLVLPVLTGFPPRHSIWLAGGLAAAAGASLLRLGGATRRRVALELGAVALAGALLAKLLLPLLPPVPLRFVSGTFALGRDGLEPVSPVESLVAGADAPAYVFVSIEAPRGVRETVQLELAGRRERASRPLEIEGGRKGGFRLWAEVLPPATPGRVSATVRTLGGQVVGRVAIAATAAAAPPAAAPYAFAGRAGGARRSATSAAIPTPIASTDAYIPGVQPR